MKWPRSRRSWFAWSMLLIIALLAIFADLSRYEPTQVRTEHGVEVLRSPTAHHWLGTDDRGRDVATRLAYGARTSLAVALGALVLALLSGTLLGAAAGTRPGVFDAAVVGLCDVINALPAPLLVIAAQGFLGRATFLSLVGLIAIAPAVYFARVARAETRRLMAEPFFEAGRAIGASHWRLLWRHALPCAGPQLAVAAAATVASAVLAEAALTFLGFGTPPPAPSWGELLQQAHHNGLLWWLAVPAGCAIALVVLAANLLSDEHADTNATRG